MDEFDLRLYFTEKKAWRKTPNTKRPFAVAQMLGCCLMLFRLKKRSSEQSLWWPTLEGVENRRTMRVCHTCYNETEQKSSSRGSSRCMSRCFFWCIVVYFCFFHFLCSRLWVFFLIKAGCDPQAWRCVKDMDMIETTRVSNVSSEELGSVVMQIFRRFLAHK